MRKNKKYRQAYRPSDNIVSRRSILSVCFGVAEIVIYLLLVFGSFSSAGNAGLLYGAAAWFAMILSVAGLILAVKSMEDTASVRIWKRIGFGLNGVILLFSVVVFFLGIIN